MFLFVFSIFQFSREDENLKLKKEEIADFLKTIQMILSFLQAE